MKFGYFDDEQREYVITTPKTPLPWINYLGTDGFYALISNTAGGYHFYKDASLRRITRFRYNNVPPDTGGRCFYVRDGDEYWSPAWKPAKVELEQYECRHGLGYTRIKGERKGVEGEILFFVPLGKSCEIQQVSLRNKSARPKRLSLFSCIEFCLWKALDDQTNFQRNLNIGEVEIVESTIYHKTEYRERRDHFSFYHVNTEVSGYDTDRESFLGAFNGFEAPQVVAAGRPNNSVAAGWSPIASHAIDLELAPGEEKTFEFLLGYVENGEDEKWESDGVINKKTAEGLIRRFGSEKQVAAAFDELRGYWENILAINRVRTPDPVFDRVVNIWNQYQCMVTFNMSRSASYFESGIGRGMGFRDSNQDVLGIAHQVPARVRERLIDLAATQLPDGGAYHQYQPLTKRGNHELGGNFNDDPLWMIASVAHYIKETGDYGLLDEQVPFENEQSNRASMFEHLKRSFYHVVNNLGPHKLPLIGRADWNDCLNLNCFSADPSDSFQTCENQDGKVAESVLIAGMFIYIGRDFVELCKRTGKEDEANEAGKQIDIMSKVVMEHGWDGEWYLRAYDHFSRKIGSKECPEGKIFIESNGFCAMAKVGQEGGYPQRALASVKEHLATRYGIVLLQPAYSKYRLELGEISSYPPGYKENASVFCHNNPWVIIAEAIQGNGDLAFDYFARITPAFLENESEIHRSEPYCYAQTVAGKDAVRFGEAKNSWLTGTASWCYHASSNWILGIRPDYDGLVIDPCIPKTWDGFEVMRFFRGATYKISVRNPKHVNKGVTRMVIDGKTLASNVAPFLGDGKIHQVEVELG